MSEAYAGKSDQQIIDEQVGTQHHILNSIVHKYQI